MSLPTARGPISKVIPMVAFSGAAVSPRPTVAALLALFGVVLLYMSTRAPDRSASFVGVWAGMAGLVVVLLSAYETVGPLPAAVLQIRPAWVALLCLGGAALALANRGRLYRRIALTAAVVAVVLATLAIATSDWDAPSGLDVYRSHQAAGDAILKGQNPYGEAVQVADGNPFAPPGSTITGYSYPPTVLGTYGLSATFTDPRIVSMVAWLGVIGWFCYSAVRHRDESELNLAVLVVASTAPVWPVVLYFGWTEPLSLGLLLLSAIFWKKKPVLSAVFLGLALSSKQYFVFLVPLLLLHRDNERIRRSVVAIGTASLTLLPALLTDAHLYIQANIENLAEIGFRTDSQSISGLLAQFGLEFSLPAGVWVVASFLLAVLLGRKSKTRGDFFLFGSLILSGSFLIGQAFPNYWFLMIGMAGMSVVLKMREIRNEANPAPISSRAV